MSDALVGSERRVSEDPESGRLVVRFPYDHRLVEMVKSIPGRQWDAAQKRWTVPAVALPRVERLLAPEGFSFDPTLRVKRSPENAPSSAEDDAPPAPRAVEGLTVGALNQRVRGALRSSFRETLWVVGTVDGWQRNAHKQHVFFELVEKEEGGGNTVARVTAVLFAGRRSRIERKLAEAPDGVALSDGVEVRLAVRVDLYPATGSYQVVVEDIDPAHTLGAIALNREQVLRALREKGLDEANGQLPLPILPLRVAFVTSWGSDAANDVLAELNRSGYAFRVDVFDAHMQGAELEGRVCRALERIADAASRYDVCLVCRGGGARTDLAWFDNLAVAIRVATLPVKVIVGIGHQRDVGVLDLIAHSEKTPTAAARFLVESLELRENALRQQATAVVRCARLSLDRAGDQLGRSGSRVVTWARSAIRRAHEVLDVDFARLNRSPDQALRASEVRIATLGASLVSLTRGRLRAERRQWEAAQARVRSAGAARLRSAVFRLDAWADTLRAHDPRRVLARGYSILRVAGEERAIRGVGDVGPGDEVRAELVDGALDLVVQSCEPMEQSDGEKDE